MRLKDRSSAESYYKLDYPINDVSLQFYLSDYKKQHQSVLVPFTWRAVKIFRSERTSAILALYIYQYDTLQYLSRLTN